jgi:hypothetical protein
MLRGPGFYECRVCKRRVPYAHDEIVALNAATNGAWERLEDGARELLGGRFHHCSLDILYGDTGSGYRAFVQEAMSDDCRVCGRTWFAVRPKAGDAVDTVLAEMKKELGR